MERNNEFISVRGKKFDYWGKHMGENKKYFKILYALIPILLGCLFYFMNQDLFKALTNGDTKQIKLLLTDNMIYLYLFMLIIMVIQNSFTLIPLILIITINISLFGLVIGFIWSVFTSIVAAVIIFFCIRYLFQDMLTKKVKPELIQKVEKNGFMYVFQARIFPFVPTSLVNILAGLSSISFYKYLVATSLGNFIYFFALALVPAGLISLDLNKNLLWALVGASIVIYVCFKKFYKKKKDSAN